MVNDVPHSTEHIAFGPMRNERPYPPCVRMYTPHTHANKYTQTFTHRAYHAGRLQARVPRCRHASACRVPRHSRTTHETKLSIPQNGVSHAFGNGSPSIHAQHMRYVQFGFAATVHKTLPFKCITFCCHPVLAPSTFLKPLRARRNKSASPF